MFLNERIMRVESALPTVKSIKTIKSLAINLKEAHLFRTIRDQHVFGLLIMIEHHQMVFAADTRLLITTESGM